MIAAHPTRAPAEPLRAFLDALSTFVRSFDSAEKRAKDDVEFIKEKFGYPEEDIEVRILPDDHDFAIMCLSRRLG